ncbi:MAG: RNA polymerase sigma factor [Acholeplasmataceae bacterium]
MNETTDFNLFYHRHKQTVTQICYSYTKNIFDTEDLVQDVFIKYLEKRPVFKDEAHEKYWLIRVAINRCHDFYKKNRPRINVDQIKISEAIADKNEDENSKHMFELICLLEPMYKSCIILYYYEDLSVKEISKVLKTSESTIKKRLERARSQLKKTWEDKTNGR